MGDLLKYSMVAIGVSAPSRETKPKKTLGSSKPLGGRAYCPKCHAICLPQFEQTGGMDEPESCFVDCPTCKKKRRLS